MNHVPLCCDHDLHSYRRLADYPFKTKNTGDLNWNSMPLKRGHIFTIPFMVKLIHLIPLPKCKHLGFYEN